MVQMLTVLQSIEISHHSNQRNKDTSIPHSPFESAISMTVVEAIGVRRNSGGTCPHKNVGGGG